MPTIKPEQIVENEMKVKVLEKSLEKLMQKNNLSFNALSQNEINSIQDQVINDLNKKYPGADIDYKRN